MVQVATNHLPNRRCGEDDPIVLGFVETADANGLVEASPLGLITAFEYPAQTPSSTSIDLKASRGRREGSATSDARPVR
jgi:hypothetical protein